MKTKLIIAGIIGLLMMNSVLAYNYKYNDEYSYEFLLQFYLKYQDCGKPKITQQIIQEEPEEIKEEKKCTTCWGFPFRCIQIDCKNECLDKLGERLCWFEGLSFSDIHWDFGRPYIHCKEYQGNGGYNYIAVTQYEQDMCKK